MDQAAIVENKVLSAALADVQQRQRKRDAEVLAKKKLTLREEDLLRKEMGEEGLATRRPGRLRTIRELALARQAAEQVKEAGGGAVEQLVAETVSRLSNLSLAARPRSVPAPSTKRQVGRRNAPGDVLRGGSTP